MKIIYEFIFPNDNILKYKVDVTYHKKQEDIDDGNKYFWTRLDFEKCSICPLKSSDFEHCPAAKDLRFLIEDFSTKVSFETVQANVYTPIRDYSKECDMQTALNSLLGVILSTSDCPILNQMKPMAFFHIPFATYEESFIRTVSFYFIRQYFNKQDGKDADFDLSNLQDYYNDLKIVNTNLKNRLLAACKKDTFVNAINAFFSLSALISFSIQDKLADIKPYFFGNGD